MSTPVEKLSGKKRDVAERLVAGTALAACVGTAIAFTPHSREPANFDTGPNLVIGDSVTLELHRAARGEFGSSLVEPNGLPYGIPQETVFRNGASSAGIQDILEGRNLLFRGYEAAVVAIGTNDAMPADFIPGIEGDGYTLEDHENILQLYRDVAAVSKCIVAVPPSYNEQSIDTAFYGASRKQRVELDKAREDLLENIVPAIQLNGSRVIIADPQPYIQEPGATHYDGIHARSPHEASSPADGEIAIKARSDVVKAALEQC